MFPIKNKNGSTLLSVIVVFAVLLIFAAAIMASAVASDSMTSAQIGMNQAYFTARSAVETTIKYITDHRDDPDVLNNLTSAKGSGSNSAMGSYEVTVSYVGTNKIKITASAKSGGQQSTVTAYMERQAAKPEVKPLEQLFYLDGDASDSFGQCNMEGNIYINGDFNLGNGSVITGKAVVTGDVTLSADGKCANGLQSLGTIYLKNGAEADGDVISLGGVYLSGDGKILGNVRTNGSLSLENGASINGSAVCMGSASFTGGVHLYGDLTAGGTVSIPSHAAFSTFITGSVSQNASVSPIQLKYNAAKLNTISVPSATQNTQLYTPVVLEAGNTIENSGILSDFNPKSLSYGSTITVDTSKNDISLLINQDYELNNGIQLAVTGPHKLYIYLTGDSSLTVCARSSITMQGGGNSTIFIVGDGSQSVSSINDSRIDAYVYIPDGSLKLSGADVGGYKFVGTAAVRNVDINNNVHCKEVQPPDLTGTPLEQAGTAAQSGGDWKLTRWEGR